MKKLTPIFITLLLIMYFRCNNAPVKSMRSNVSETKNASLDSVVFWLLNASAKDFYDHQPPIPVDFRDVQLRNLIGANEENHYLICGQFLFQDHQNRDKWTDFATIKTSGYEQWIGKQSMGYCQDAKVVSYQINDLSAALKSRVDSLQHLKDLSK